MLSVRVRTAALRYLLGLGVKLVLVHASVVDAVFLAAGDTDLHLQPDLGAGTDRTAPQNARVEAEGDAGHKRQLVTRLVAARRNACLTPTLTNERITNQKYDQ